MDDIVIRELEIHDLENGFIQTLSELSEINISLKDAEILFLYFFENNDYYIYIVEYDDMVIGAATLFIERKFLHNGGLSGHIEDVVVRKKYRDMDIGKQLVMRLIEKAKEVGCYKVVLDCGCDVAPFYDKLGMIGDKVLYKIKFEKHI